MIEIGDREPAGTLGIERLRSLGFVLNARGWWLLNNTPRSKKSSGGPLSPRSAGATKRSRCCIRSAAPSDQSRRPSACGSRAVVSKRAPPRRTTAHSSFGRSSSPPSPCRRCPTPQPSTEGASLGTVAYSLPFVPPVKYPDHTAAAPARRSLHRRHVRPVSVDAAVTHGVGWPQSGRTPPPSLSPVPRPLLLPRVDDDQGRAHLPAPHEFPWSPPGIRSGETASAAARGGSCEGHGPGAERRTGTDATAPTPSRRGSTTSVASASSASSSVASVLSRLDYDDHSALHEALPRVFSRSGASSSWPPSPTPALTPSPAPSPLRSPAPPSAPPPTPAPAPSTPSMSDPAALALLPTELRVEIAMTLAQADMIALRRAYPVAFGFIYDEEARYQRLYQQEWLAVREAARNLGSALTSGAASLESLVAGRRRLQRLMGAMRPWREALLQYAIRNQYHSDEIRALVRAYLVNNIGPWRDDDTDIVRRGRQRRPRSW